MILSVILILSPSLKVGLDILYRKKIKERIIEQPYKPVLWSDSLELVREMGYTDIIECGFGNVQTKLLKRDYKGFNILNPRKYLQST